jgi:hypothetical protein
MMTLPQALAAALVGLLAIPASGLETGPNDFRVTQFGTDGDLGSRAIRQEMAYNTVDNQVLTVFFGTTDTDSRVAPQELELWSLALSAIGTPLGPPTLITAVNGLGNNSNGHVLLGARGLEFDPNRRGYVVVYDAVDSSFGSDSFGIYARLLDTSGQPSGAVIAVTSNATVDTRPQVAINALDNEFLVVWTRITESINRQIRGRRFDATTGAALAADFRIDAVDGFKTDASIAFDSENNQYLVAWRNNVEAPEFQLLNSDGSTKLPSPRVFASPGYHTTRPQVVYNPDDDEFLIAFNQSDPARGIVQESYEMFGRRIDSTGNPLGPDKFRISHSDFVPTFGRRGVNIDCTGADFCLNTARPSITYSSIDKSYAASWSANRNNNGTGEFECFVRIFDGGADATNEPEQFEISNMGGESPLQGGLFASIIAKPGGYLTLWWGDDTRNGGVDDEFEIWGQNLLTDLIFESSFSGD